MAHRSQLIIGLVAFLLLNLIPAAAQQGIDRPAVSAVEGVVVRFGTGEPLAEAEVELSKTDGGPAYTATTGGDGKFAFQNLVPGEYRLVASHAGGFMQAEYGQRSPTGRGIPIVLPVDHRITGVQLSMAQTGSISGRIFDEDGEPLGSVSVQALKATYALSSQQRRLAIAQVVQTNDLGEYRLFWLPPGRYYISARRGGSQPFVVPPDSDVTEGLAGSPAFLTQRTLENGDFVEEAHVPVYFPGSTDSRTASAIDLSVGGNVGGMDFIIPPPVPARHIRGVVINGTTGQPEAEAFVTVTPRTFSHDMITANGRTGENGAFDLRGVIPGSYFVAAAIGEEMDMTGNVSVEVAGDDLENIAIVARPGIDIPGRVIFDGWSANSGPPPRVIPDIVRAVMIPGLPFGTSLRSPAPNLQPDNTFVLRGVAPGDYRVILREFRAIDPLQRVYVKSMRLGPLDVLSDGLHIEAKPETELEIVVGVDVSRLDGEVIDQREQPIPNATVVLVPNPPAPGRTDLYRNVSSDVFGRFHIEGLAPGEYIVLAWEDVEFGAWQDPEFVRTYESSGTRIRIGEGTSENIRVTISQ